MKTNSIFHVEGLSYSYRLGEETIEALQSIETSIPSGRLVCLSGPSGSGKSTLLNLFGLLDKPKSGKLFFKGQDVNRLSEKEKEKARLFDLGFIFQSFNLFPTLTAEENVEYFLHRQGLSKLKRRERVDEALKMVGIEGQKKKFPHQMSGGQRQRVAIARALAKKPSVILADEPTASLDQANGKQVIQILKEGCRQFGLSAIVASHDGMVLESADDNIRLRDGKIDRT